MHVNINASKEFVSINKVTRKLDFKIFIISLKYLTGYEIGMLLEKEWPKNI
jgi:hypothetical protein